VAGFAGGWVGGWDGGWGGGWGGRMVTAGFLMHNSPLPAIRRPSGAHQSTVAFPTLLLLPHHCWLPHEQALTRGPRPIEMHAHDPRRYVSGACTALAFDCCWPAGAALPNALLAPDTLADSVKRGGI
jgi:hypothetical protein